MTVTVNTGVSTPNTAQRTSSAATPTGTSDMTTGSNNVATPTPTPELETATPTPTSIWDNWGDYRRDVEDAFYGTSDPDEKQEKMSTHMSGPNGTNHGGAAVAGAIWATGRCIYDGVSNLFR